MNAIVRAVKATYNFFAGDAIILAAVTLAFALTESGLSPPQAAGREPWR